MNSTALPASYPFADPAIGSLYQAFEHSRLVIAISAAIYYWDFIVTLPVEIKYIWPGSLTVIKTAYFFNRYWTLSAQAVNLIWAFRTFASATCRRWWWLKTYACLLVYPPCQTVIVCRLVAIWDRSIRVSIGMSALLCAGCLATIITSLGEKPVSIPPPLNYCLAGFPTTQYDRFWTIWLPSLVIETVSIILTMIKLKFWFELDGRSDLLQRLARDSLFYFVVVLCFNIVNIAKYMLTTSGNKALLYLPSLTAMSILTSRMVLGIKTDLARRSTRGSLPNLSPTTPKYAKRNVFTLKSFSQSHSSGTRSGQLPSYLPSEASIIISQPPPSTESGIPTNSLGGFDDNEGETKGPVKNELSVSDVGLAV